MKQFIFCLALFSLLSGSCQKIFFNDDERTREIPLESFHAVKFSGIYNIVLVQDSTDRLVITGKNDINSIDAVTRDDTLVIDDHKNRSFNPYKNTLVLHFSDLEYLLTADPVNISTIDTLKSDELYFLALGEIEEVRLVFKCNSFTVVNDANTLGYFHFTGKATSCWIWDRYGSCMYADSLQCKDAVVYNQSVGDVSINASDNLYAFIRGPGNIYYRGNPVIQVGEKRGTGNIIRLN